MYVFIKIMIFIIFIIVVRCFCCWNYFLYILKNIRSRVIHFFYIRTAVVLYCMSTYTPQKETKKKRKIDEQETEQ